MRLSIRHTTRYRFDEPVVHAVQRVRLTPKATQGQKVLEWTMQYENAAQQLQYEDQHHNTVTLVAVDEGASEVVVECKGVVETEDHAGVIGNHSGHLPLWSFLSFTDRTRPGPRIKEMVESIGRDGDTLAVLHALSDRIRDQVAYRIGSTRVDTTGEEAFEGGAGVCQDHSHIFIAAARLLDIPARYVSGYLMMNDRVEQDASHAWAEAYVKGLGWVGFDISNGISPDQRYVRVATGRDYGDASPITGISYGAVRQDLEVDIAVEQQQIEQ